MSQSIFSLKKSDYKDIDERLKPFLNGWKLVENYKNKTVTIPGDWNSDVYPYKYFKVIKSPTDHNYSSNGEEDEIGLSLECGWMGYDTECIINLFIIGSTVKSGMHAKIGAEILKAGGAPMKLYWNGKLITDFVKYSKGWWNTCTPQDKVWVNDMRKYF